MLDSMGITHKQSRQRVLFVLPGLEAGGAERVMITLLNGIENSGYDPVLLSVRGNGPLRKTVSPLVPFWTLNQNLTPSSVPLILIKMLRIKPHIVISTMSHMNFATLALKIFFPKTTFIVREAITPSFFLKRKRKRNLLIKFLFKILYPKAEHILSPTQKVFDEFQDFLPLRSDQFSVLKNPVKLDKLREKINFEDRVETNLDVVKFVACGRLHKQKGFARLLENLSKLTMPYNWRLDIIGEGEERGEITELIENLNLSEHVFLQGLVIPPYSFFATADCFLLPSYFEGLPNVVLESLACGTPVIATSESGGIDEIQNECGSQNVRIAEDMDGFIQKMSMITPQNKEEPASSLLAECYHEHFVIHEFTQLLDRLGKK